MSTSMPAILRIHLCVGPTETSPLLSAPAEPVVEGDSAPQQEPMVQTISYRKFLRSIKILQIVLRQCSYRFRRCHRSICLVRLAPSVTDTLRQDRGLLFGVVHLSVLASLTFFPNARCLQIIKSHIDIRRHFILLVQISMESPVLVNVIVDLSIPLFSLGMFNQIRVYFPDHYWCRSTF